MFGFAAPFLVATASKPLFDMAGGAVGAYIDQFLLTAKYDANMRARVFMPSPADIWEAYLAGFFTKDAVPYAMGLHGINLFGEDKNATQSTGKKLWTGVLSSKLPRLSIEQLVYMLYSEQITVAQFNSFVKNYAMQDEHGGMLMKMLLPKFDQGVLFSNYLRGYSTPDKTREAFKRYYGCNTNDANKIMDLSMQLPPVSDIIRFAVRDVYNPEMVTKLQLDSEYTDNTQMMKWAKASGIGVATINTEMGAPETRDILLDYWRAHWQLPSPTQCYEFLHRLRPDRIAQLQDQFPNLSAFLPSTLNTYLKANDYVPEVREWLAAVSYKTIGRIDLRRLYNDNIIPDVELLGQIKDQGYNDRDSQFLLDWMQQQKEDKAEKDDEKKQDKLNSRLRTQILAAYKDGSISRDGAYARLRISGMDDDESAILLEAIDIEISRAVVREYIKQVKSEFFMGAYDGLQAFAELREGNVADLRAAQLVQIWQRQMTRKRKSASTKQIIEWYVDGYITFDDASSRLSILGWTGADQLLLMQQASDDRDAKLAAIQAKQERDSRQAVLAQEKLIKEQQALLRRQVSQAERIAPPSRLEKWYSLGLITLDEIRNMLTYYAWDLMSINRFIAQLMLTYPQQQGESNETKQDETSTEGNP